MPRVLITGAAGFIGMHTSIRFLREGWDVIGLDNMNDYYSVVLKKDRLKEIRDVSKKTGFSFEMFEADLNSNVWEKLGGLDFDSVIHLAAQAGVRYSLENPMAYVDSNIRGFQKALEFVNRNRINQFLYASSSSVYGMDTEEPFNENSPCNSPESYYAATKKANELMAHAYFKTHKISSVGLRFFTVYGPWGRPDMAPLKFLKAAYQNREVEIYNHGKQLRDFTYISDVVDSIYKINQIPFTGNHIINVGKGQPDMLLNFVENIELISGRTLQKNFVDRKVGDVTSTYADITLLKSYISEYNPIDLHEGLEYLNSWYVSYYDLKKSTSI